VTIVDIYGHEALRRRLSASLATGALPGSLLFHGPRGVGKQRLALWLAQALLCAEAEAPCGACQSCRYMRDLTHPDLHWVFPRPRLKDADASPEEVRADYADAIAERAKTHGLYAAPSGIEGIFVSTVRTLVQDAAMSPAISKRKVFIIGDAERMVAQEGADFAANAFLKLLEEPPANSTIILTSSEPGALLPTIRSRVVAVRVTPIAESEVKAFAEEPTVKEFLDGLDKSSSAERARKAEGAPGKLLDGDDGAHAILAARKILEAALSDRSAVKYATALARARPMRAAPTPILSTPSSHCSVSECGNHCIATTRPAPPRPAERWTSHSARNSSRAVT
jgi:DNA polymerase III, gamma/tau subunits